MSKRDELIFVYNADSGRWNTYMDIMHKVFSPKTYPCSLCAITHRAFAVENQWKDFIETSEIPMVFLHRDEWLADYGIQCDLPAVFMKRNGSVEIFINAKECNEMDLDQLIERISEKDN